MAAPTTHCYVGEPQREVYQCEDISSDFKRLVVQLAGSLDDDESRRKIRYLYKDKLGHGAEAMKALEMLEKLEEKGVFSARNLHQLESLLKDSDHHDLVETHLEPYRKKYTDEKAGEKATLHHSLSSPPTAPSHSSLTRPIRSTSSPVSIGSHLNTSRHRQVSAPGMLSIQEERSRTTEEAPNPSQPTSLYVYGHGVSKVTSSGMGMNRMSGIGMNGMSGMGMNRMSGIGMSSHQSESGGCLLPVKPQNSLPAMSNGMREDESIDPEPHPPVSFEVGSTSAPHDVESQFNFPMETNLPSADISPAEVRSKLTLSANTESLANVLTRSFQQANNRTHTNTPLAVAEKTSVEATERGSNEACIVASQTKPHSLLSASAPPQRKEGETAIPMQSFAGSTLADIDNTCASTTGSNPDREWHSKPEQFLLNRAKMAAMISKHKTTHYKRFKSTIPVSSSKKGVHLTVEIFPFGLLSDMDPRHATVLVHVFLTSSKCLEMAEHCRNIVEVKVGFANFATLSELSTRTSQAELSPKSCEACIQVEQALSHKDIIYSRTKYIQLTLEATLYCKDRVLVEPLTDPEHPDFLQVNVSST